MQVTSLYQIIDKHKASQGNIEVTLQLNKQHDLYNGHFPNNPILPGVMLLQIIKECCEAYINKPLFLQNALNMKFLAPVNPFQNDVLKVTVFFQKEGNELKVKNSTTFADGTEVAKGTLTFSIQ